MLTFFIQVDEMMENTERAAARYSKSICLLRFLLVEASSLVLNPPVSLTNSDRYRLRSYIDIISNRRGQSRSQRVDLLKCEDHQKEPLSCCPRSNLHGSLSEKRSTRFSVTFIDLYSRSFIYFVGVYCDGSKCFICNKGSK